MNGQRAIHFPIRRHRLDSFSEAREIEKRRSVIL